MSFYICLECENVQHFEETGVMEFSQFPDGDGVSRKDDRFYSDDTFVTCGVCGHTGTLPSATEVKDHRLWPETNGEKKTLIANLRAGNEEDCILRQLEMLWAIRKG